MTFSQAQLQAAESFISKNRKNLFALRFSDPTIPREVWLVAAAMQEERERCAVKASKWAFDLDGFADKTRSELMFRFAKDIRSPSSDPKRQGK